MSETSPPIPVESIVPADVRTWKLVPTEPVPETLFVCSARVRDDVAQALHAMFEHGAEPAEDIRAIYEDHLVYSHDLGEKFYEAGLSADFTEILYMYRTENMTEACELMHADPFHKEDIVANEWFFEWHIHAPTYKSSLPAMPEQVRPVEVEITTPQNLIASFGHLDVQAMMGWLQNETAARPIFDVLHLRNMHGDGGLSNMGLAWACGPIAGGDKVLHVLAVPSVEIAKEVNDMEALSRWGVLKDFRYFEWCIHYPVRKACPRHKHTLQRLIGIRLDSGR